MGDAHVPRRQRGDVNEAMRIVPDVNADARAAQSFLRDVIESGERDNRVIIAMIRTLPRDVEREIDFAAVQGFGADNGVDDLLDPNTVGQLTARRVLTVLNGLFASVEIIEEPAHYARMRATHRRSGGRK